VLFSSKISNSVLNYLEAQNIGLEALLSDVETPEEFLRDPSSWIEADDLEKFLSCAERVYENSRTRSANATADHRFAETVGHAAKELRSWGVLDGVLKMMKSPDDIYAQPDRLLSYFISPPPILQQSKRGPHKLEFQLDLASQRYPLTAQYLTAAIEALADYVGQPFARAGWDGHLVKIEWSIPQETLFVEDPGHTTDPAQLALLLAKLDEQTRESERRAAEVGILQREVDRLKARLARQSGRVPSGGELAMMDRLATESAEPLRHLVEDMARMNDYFTRAHQLITLLVGHDRMSPQIRNSMKKVDWELVAVQFPLLSRQSRERLMGGLSSLGQLRALCTNVSERPMKADAEATLMTKMGLDRAPNLPN
jgi:hypothetical protein